MRKVAIFIQSLGAGGAERIVSYLLHEARGRFEVHLILLKDEIAYPVPEGTPVKVISLGGSAGAGPLGVLLTPLLARRLKAYLEAHGIETLLSLLNRPNLVAAHVKNLGWRGRVIVSERADTLAYYGSRRFGWLMIALVRRLYPRADVVTAISRGIGLSLGRLGVHDVRVIYNPIHPAPRVPPAKPGPFTYITVGRLEPQKNQALLIRAFARLPDGDSRLILLGKGSLQGELVALAQSLGVAERVQFAGLQSDVGAWLDRAHCFVFSSDFEGFGNVLLEAMNAGLPIVSTDCPYGPREILAPGTDPARMLREGNEAAEFGILTPVGSAGDLAQAMETLRNDPALRERYWQAGARRVLDFDIKAIAEQYFELMSGPARASAAASDAREGSP